MNTQTDNAEYIDIVMPIYNLIEYSENYSKTSGSLWQYCNNNNSYIAGRLDVEIMILLKYLNNSWRNFEIPLINCEIELILD